MGERWWQRGILYQVYPRSYVDANGDGVGDLPGVISRLDYLEWLGVDALWLSPIYPSPMKDFGYDVADYTGVDPLFGTLEDFDRLVAQARARGLKVVLDFVPNHTSDQHPWFRESGASRDNPKRDWYLWRDAPNNWLSNFGGSAWQFDEATGQYYYHAFLPEQPDLNWRNPEVVQAMLEVLRFWLERGVDGFRVDVLWHLVKDEHFADNPANPAWREGMDPYQALVPLHSSDRPEVHAVVAQLRRLLDEYPERVLIGEIYLPLERLMSYYGAGASGDMRGAHLPLQFPAPRRALGRAPPRRPDRRVRAPAAAARVAQLGARQPRPPARRLPRRAGAGARRGDAAPHAARHADPLLRRRDRHGERSHPARQDPGSLRAQSPGHGGSAATRCERRCSGARRRTPASRAASRGFRFHRITDW